jgi:molybdopterin/thiamine biosynthesis adenylyltransferase
VIKAITKKYMPINSVYIHSCEEVLCFDYEKLAEGNVETYYKNEIKPEEKSKYSELKLVLGNQVFQNLMNLKLFMIGAGAIGCELLKNYALLGISSGEKGRIILTDPDVIEHSNLSR